MNIFRTKKSEINFTKKYMRAKDDLEKAKVIRDAHSQVVKLESEKASLERKLDGVIESLAALKIDLKEIEKMEEHGSIILLEDEATEEEDSQESEE